MLYCLGKKSVHVHYRHNYIVHFSNKYFLSAVGRIHKCGIHRYKELTVHNEVIVRIFTGGCNITTVNFRIFLSSAKEATHALAVIPLHLMLPSLSLRNYYLFSVDFSILKIHICGIRVHFLCDFLLSLSVMFTRFIHVVVLTSTLILL